MNDVVMETKKKTQFTNEASREVFDITYRVGKEDINERLWKVAEKIAEVEKDSVYWTNEFYNILTDFTFVPGGRILSNAGTDFKGTTFINCFVDGFTGEDKDSMEGIMSTLRRQAMILKSEGGYGFCADVMRPKGAYISGIGNSTPGAVKMLDMWNTQSAVITEGAEKKKKKGKNKIRKGAQMVTLSIWHPDVEEFITAKQTPNRLTKFNMSVLVTDRFMKAVKNHEPWHLEFPDIDADKEMYEKVWDGNLEHWKIDRRLPTKIYKTFEDANELWDLITDSTYNRNEPGVLFVDTINRWNNLYYNEYITATNPCGEQILPVGGVCLLGSLNLTQFIDFENNTWDYQKLHEYIPKVIRFMDNVNDLTYVPLESQKENLKNKRRIGMGIMGYGSALLMMNKRYGSNEALKLTADLMNFITNTAYQSSAILAKEKGAFPEYEAEQYLAGKFVQKLNEDTLELIKQFGLRNSHLLSIQPTGNTGVLANNVSGGLEPVFSLEYWRTMGISCPGKGLKIPKNVDWANKTFDENPCDWQWITEGDDSMLSCEFEGETFKFDANRGLTKQVLVVDYGVDYLRKNGKFDENAEGVVTSAELTIDEHINTMEVLSKYICSAMSKTINLPNDYPYEDFKDVYFKAYETGTIKGVTTYRVGTMASVLSAKKKSTTQGQDVDENGRNGHIIKNPAPKRPKTVSCDVHHLTCKGVQWTVFVGLVIDEDGELSPYEIFAFKKKLISLPDRIQKGTLTKIKSGRYDFETEDGLVLEDIASLFDRDEQEALTRSISLALRHGAHIKYAVEQLNKTEGDFQAFSKAIARTLKKYINDNEKPSGNQVCPECQKEGLLRYQEGCITCLACNWSKC